MGAIVGAVSGLIMGGILRAVDRSKVPLIAGFGIFGLSIIGNAIYEAAPPECYFTHRA